MPLRDSDVTVKRHNFNAFAFENLDAEPIDAEMWNTEDYLALYLEYDQNNRPIAYGGPLQEYGNYTMEQILWHWLEPAKGQEATPFAAELHILFYHINYRKLIKSKGNPYYSCMAMVFPFKVVQETRLRFFSEISQLLPMLRTPSEVVFVPNHTIPLLAELINGNISQFYSYQGATCYTDNRREVTWFDFISPIEVGIDFAQQMEYIEAKDHTPIIKKLVKQESPQGVILKSFDNSGVTENIVAAVWLFILFFVRAQIQEQAFNVN
ncbi:uncharacterized protein LOC105261518 [Musca domestica]|uniref:Uncharacterized protein LOC105261518 n=1 Tax=Musca domestica TaxID=7370 RepID=A0A1I8NKG6_MUSDO|nr:uncharacterized protein LOC105261518 [Musca domestica]